MMTFARFARTLALAIVALATGQTAQAQEAPAPCPWYEVIGEGPDLVLTPGLGSSPAVWDEVVGALSADYRIHLVHVAGFAGRAARGDPASVIDRAAAEVIRHLDCECVDSALYAGHSLGGFLGMKLAAEHPDRIERLVVVDALPFYPLIFSPAASAETVRPQADAFRDQILAQDDAAFEASQRQGVRALVKERAYHDMVVGWSLASDRATFAAGVHALMTTDLRGQLAGIDTPTTVIAAANAFAPRSRIEPLYRGAYENLEGVDLIIVEDSYHFIMFDQPEAFLTTLRAALEGSGG